MMGIRKSIFILSLLSLFFLTKLFAQGADLFKYKINGINTKSWPDFQLYIQHDQSLIPQKISDFQIKVNWNNQECILKNFAKYSDVTKQPNHVFMIVDNSSSMKNKIQYVNQAYKIFIDGLRNNSYVSMIRFREPTQEYPWGSRFLAQSSNSSYFLKSLNIFSLMTMRTYFYDACYQALVYFDTFVEGGQKSIVVLSDGNDVGSSVSFSKLNQRAVDAGIPFYFIDFSAIANRNKDAKLLCENTNGSYAASSDPKELSDIYFDILKKINNQFVIKCRFPNAQLKYPQNGKISVEFFNKDAQRIVERNFKVSTDRKNQIKFLTDLIKSGQTSHLPPKGIINNWGLYTEDCWYDLGLAGIEKKNFEITKKAISVLEISEEILSNERADLLRIKQAQQKESLNIGDLYQNYSRKHYGSLLADENLWNFVGWNISNKNEERAILLAKKLVKIYPWSRYCDEALIFLAQSEIKKGNYAEAEKIYSNLTQLYGNSDKYGEGLLQLSNLYIIQGKSKKAEELLLAHKDEYQTLSEGGQLYYQLALTQTRLNKYLPAIKTIDQLLELIPDSPKSNDALLLQADIYWQNLSLPEKAKNIYQSLIIKKGVEEGVLSQAREQYNQLLVSSTPEYLLKELEKTPTDANLLKIMKENNWQEGKDLPDNFLTLATSLIEKNQLEKALEISQAVANDYKVLGVQDRAQYLSAEIYSKQGDLENQTHTLEMMLEQYPVSSLANQAKQNLAESYLKLGNQRDALTVYEELLLSVDENYLELEAIKSDYKKLREKARVFIEGKLTGIANEDLSKVELIVHNLPSLEVMATTKPALDGSYKLDLPLGKQYTLIAKAPGYLPFTQDLDYRDVISAKNIQEELGLTLIKKGAKVTLKNVLFNFGSSKLRPESIPTLNEMIDFLKKNSQLEIEISGHTDNVGGYGFNKQLSNNRALRVARYILEHGCSLKNVVTKGYADKKPIANNDTEKGRALNRRVELKILK